MWSAKILFLDIIIAISVVAIVLCITFLMAFPYDRYFQGNATSISQINKIAKTGDVILFASTHPELRWSSLSSWSHIGMVVQNPNDIENPLFLESDVPLFEHERGVQDLLTQQKDKNGVKLIPLKEKLERYNGTMVYRKLIHSQQHPNAVNLMKTFSNRSRFEELLPWLQQNYADHKYENSVSFWMRSFAKFRKMNPFAGVGLKPAGKRKKIFCSELVYNVYSHLGIVRPMKASNILPKHFSKTAVYNILQPGWSLGEHIRISQ